MSNIWSTEAWAIAIAVTALVLLGLLTNNWFIASLLTSGAYIAWLYRRLLKLENWIRKGTRTSQVYEDAGFVGIIIRQLHEQKKVHNQRKRRTKQILRRLNQIFRHCPTPRCYSTVTSRSNGATNPQSTCLTCALPRTSVTK